MEFLCVQRKLSKKKRKEPFHFILFFCFVFFLWKKREKKHKSPSSKKEWMPFFFQTSSFSTSKKKEKKKESSFFLQLRMFLFTIPLPFFFSKWIVFFFDKKGTQKEMESDFYFNFSILIQKKYKEKPFLLKKRFLFFFFLFRFSHTHTQQQHFSKSHLFFFGFPNCPPCFSFFRFFSHSSFFWLFRSFLQKQIKGRKWLKKRTNSFLFKKGTILVFQQVRDEFQKTKMKKSFSSSSLTSIFHFSKKKKKKNLFLFLRDDGEKKPYSNRHAWGFLDTLERNVRSKPWWFTEFCNSH